ncbi:histidine--tRNA ligase [Nitrososphaera sp.]|uniref:histidine--tRNA ligase n=1 Tax=Nitrososphaera sp. TaxID=1971748 RepID=UPI0025E4C2BB|nr:histidine--tRNA ligase [Nitrososphaera sp.]
MKIELPRGMRDVEPEDLDGINYVRDRFFETARLFNFKMMEPTPIELLSTLEAKSGASISNEIYAFKDKGDRDVALRFDLTIGLTRYVALRRDLKMPVKLASFAGVWRYDEPQAGRYRYFHQWDIEVYGPKSQESDAEVIEFVASFFKKLGLEVSIQVNDRQVIEQFIREKLGITEEEKVLEMFRAVDKVSKKGAPAVIEEYKESVDPIKLQALLDLSQIKGSVDYATISADIQNLEGWDRLVSLMDSLKSRKVDNAFLNLGIVRGLDYYSGMVFEVFDANSDGGALVGGGRYDRLTDAFGRKDIGATGAAGGIERILMALQKRGAVTKQARPLVYVAYASDDMKGRALEMASLLRNSGIPADYDILGRALRKQLDDAASRDATIAVIVAASDMAEGKVTVRSMKDGTENKQPFEGIIEMIRSMEG